MKYTILSPDGFSINMEGGFKTQKEAKNYFDKWVKQFEKQGYYSSPQFGRIPIKEIQLYCEFKRN